MLALILKLLALIVLVFSLSLRASKSLSEGYPNSSHDLRLTSIFCRQAHQRVKFNLASLSNSADLEIDSSIVDIAKEVTANRGVVSTRPLRI